MKRVNVRSSNLESIGYDSDDRTLEIEFKNGDIYLYSNVPQSLYDSLMNASSHGQFLDRYIKKAGYKYIQIR